MDEARASWNTVYHSKEGFECQITLRDEDEVSVAERAKKVLDALIKSGATPLKRLKYNDNAKNNNGNGGANQNSKNGGSKKTYFDEQGVRRCNRKLKSGEICGQVVSEREGKYGPFWSCPNYKEHAS